jgi:hypothetical protein
LSLPFPATISSYSTQGSNVHQKKTFKAGLKFESDDVLFGKLRPYLKNWFLADKTSSDSNFKPALKVFF